VRDTGVPQLLKTRTNHSKRVGHPIRRAGDPCQYLIVKNPPIARRALSLFPLQNADLCNAGREPDCQHLSENSEPSVCPRWRISSRAPDSWNSHPAAIGQRGEQRQVGNDRRLWHPDGEHQMIVLFFNNAAVDIDRRYEASFTHLFNRLPLAALRRPRSGIAPRGHTSTGCV
jgi:hypothetical protein